MLSRESKRKVWQEVGTVKAEISLAEFCSTLSGSETFCIFFSA